VYNPVEVIGRKPREEDFVSEVTETIRNYITNKIASDSRAIEREV